ncbi:Heterokaryon incompatibility protein 6, OR allele [Madurella mycetomatis]|uniref:Heterokaryon incompatibility protein 6, OR allele n=1 Tax=Madurella mycetomatis TaxID=100816 RepID=A0A175VVL0_9PEZI|nr:Heterokaryon incompatibility protein 6, OR allele [Madurella mycetomatis]
MSRKLIMNDLLHAILEELDVVETAETENLEWDDELDCEENKVTTDPFLYSYLPKPPAQASSEGTLSRLLRLLSGTRNDDIECELIAGSRGKPFRLLRLLPGTRRDDIECELVATYLGQNINSYDALSYVWGENPTMTPIQVNGRTLKISSNLRCALLNLRLVDSTRVLWIDSICIDQNDVVEKADQIAIMGDIYRFASQTIVWLGDAQGRSTAVAFAHIKTLADEAHDLKMNPHKIMKPRECHTYKIVSDDNSLQDTIVNHPWWSRVWTAQEILLSKRATLVKGHYQVDWDRFCSAMHHGVALGIWERVILGQIVKSPIQNFFDVQALRNPPVLGNAADRLLFYLFRTRARNATNPLDKIYAVLGMISADLQDIGIRPNYSSSPAEVYLAATQRLIAVSQNLDILGACDPTHPMPEAPSWVAHWGSNGAKMASPMVENSVGGRRATHASRGSPAKAAWDDGSRTLVLQGQPMDTITRVSLVQAEYDSPDISDSDSDSDGSFDLEDFVRCMWSDVRKIYNQTITGISFNLRVYLEWECFVKELNPTNPGLWGGDESRPMSVYCATLCTGTLAPGGVLETARLFGTWLDKLESLREKQRFRGLARYVSRTWHGYGEFFQYMTHVAERRLGATGNGWLCLLPKATETGDRIYLVKGGRVPVVLRPRNDGDQEYMEFIGEAYVHGIMDGELFDEGKCVEIRIR